MLYFKKIYILVEVKEHPFLLNTVEFENWMWCWVRHTDTNSRSLAHWDEEEVRTARKAAPHNRLCDGVLLTLLLTMRQRDVSCLFATATSDGLKVLSLDFSTLVRCGP